MKLDLLTNATVVDDAIRFVSSQQEEKAKANCRIIENQDNSTNDIQGSEEENQQQQCGAAAAATTNHTF
jgi:hypothetical protein